MQRRALLATLGTSIAGSVTGCLGSLQGDTTAACSHESLPGHAQWRYDACNSGHAAGIRGPTEEPKFQRMYQGPRASPLTANDTLYTRAWSAEIGGDVRWHVEEYRGRSDAQALYGDSVVGSVWEPFHGMWAISSEDGSERWRAELSPGPHGPLEPLGPLTIQGDRAYYATLTGVGCVDLAAGEEAWVADLDAAFPYSLVSMEWYVPAVTSAHIFALTTSYGSDRDWDSDPRQLYALDPDTGDLDWTVEFEPGEEWITAAPMVGDGLVFVRANVDGHPDPAYDEATRVIAVDPSTQEVVWRQTLPVQNGIALAATANGRFYVTQGDGKEVPAEFVALDTTDGSEVWRAEHETQLLAPTITEDSIVASDGNHLRAFDLETGDALWNVDLVSQVLNQTDIDVADFRWRRPAVPVVHDGRVFVYLGEDRVVEFS